VFVNGATFMIVLLWCERERERERESVCVCGWVGG